MARGAAVRGLGAGLLSTGAGLAVSEVYLRLVPDDPPCDSDLACLPDLDPLFNAVAIGLLVLGVTGPLFAALLRLRGPWLFALPVVWAGVLMCAGAQFTTGPLGAVLFLVLLMVPYVLIGARTQPDRLSA